MKRRSLVSVIGAALLASGIAFAIEPPLLETGSLEQFKAAVRGYVQLHRAIERQLPPPRARSDAQDIVKSSDAMASALQTARAHAREGDLFQPAIVPYLRDRISEALTAHGILPEALLASNIEEADDQAALPVVNGRFPWGRGALMWPCVLEVLPGLPQELQYRFVGRDLVLLDTHADLVVDILRNAVRQ